MVATLRAVSIRRNGDTGGKPIDRAVLDAQQRHIRRKLVSCERGTQVMVDLEKPVILNDGDCLVLEDRRTVQIVAADEELMEVRAQDNERLLKLTWHIGNRHLEAQIEPDRILLRRDHVIAHMLEHQGATVRNVIEPFTPEHGAYHGHGHSHDH
jgi:urease accessory protein